MERLDDIVVGAVLQPRDPVERRGAARDHDDRHVVPGPDLAREQQSVLIAKHQIERDEADRRLLLQALQELRHSAGFGHRIAFGHEPLAQCQAHRWLVVDDEDVNAGVRVRDHDEGSYAAFSPVAIGP